VTAVLAGVVALTFFTIPLFWAGIATGSTSLLWFVITVQGVRRRDGPALTRREAGDT